MSVGKLVKVILNHQHYELMPPKNLRSKIRKHCSTWHSSLPDSLQVPALGMEVPALGTIH